MSHIDFRRHFDISSEILLLNSGTQSLTPRLVRESQLHHAAEYERNPTRGLLAAWGMLWKIQKELGQFFGASPGDLFLRPNVSAAMNAFVLGFRGFSKGDEIAIGALEYGAVAALCRHRAEKDGLTVKVLSHAWRREELAQTSPAEFARRLVEQTSSRTKMLVLSHVLT
ncbi:MAG: hypothetical protein AAB425_02320, partial [Bdellovibrionota bacterium]